jgi:hypothetical protein
MNPETPQPFDVLDLALAFVLGAVVALAFAPLRSLRHLADELDDVRDDLACHEDNLNAHELLSRELPASCPGEAPAPPAPALALVPSEVRGEATEPGFVGL